MITAVVCSDDRMRYVCKSLHMEMEIIAIDEDSDFLTLPRLDAIILPVKGIDDEGYMKLYDSLVHVLADSKRYDYIFRNGNFLYLSTTYEKILLYEGYDCD